MILETYKTLGGLHPETTVLQNILAACGVRSPHTGRPFTEAMLLGIGGGLGMGYILWEFEQPGSKELVLGFRNDWQYPVQFLQKLCERIQVGMQVQETESPAQAAEWLRQALDAGQPAMIWVDLAGMPYLLLPASLAGHIGHVVGVFGLDEEKDIVYVDDRARQPFCVSREAFSQSRARIPLFKNRQILFSTQAEVSLEQAILAGLHDCVEELHRPSESFALPALKKWGRLMTDSRNEKGWPRVFANRKGLFNVLKSVYENVQPIGPSGGALRGLYAEFLDEASALVKKPKLRVVAERYRSLDRLWTQLAESSLPDPVNHFKQIKQLLAEKHHQRVNLGYQGVSEMEKVEQQLTTISRTAAFALTDTQIERLFAELQAQIFHLFEMEREAAAALKSALL